MTSAYNTKRSFGYFLASSKQLDERIAKAKKTVEKKKTIEDVEYKANTAMFLYYFSLIYCVDLRNQYESLWSESERKSSYGKEIEHNLDKANEILQSGFDDILSRCGGQSGINKFGNLLSTAILAVAPLIENQRTCIYNAIVNHYTKGKDNKKADNKAMFASFVINARRLVLMAIHSSKVATDDYGESYPLMYDILHLNSISSSLSFLGSIYNIVTRPIKELDLSQDSDCSKAQSEVIKTIASRDFYKSVIVLFDLRGK